MFLVSSRPGVIYKLLLFANEVRLDDSDLTFHGTFCALQLYFSKIFLFLSKKICQFYIGSKGLILLLITAKLFAYLYPH